MNRDVQKEQETAINQWDAHGYTAHTLTKHTHIENKHGTLWKMNIQHAAHSLVI